MSISKDNPGSQTMFYSGSLLHLDTSTSKFKLTAEYKKFYSNLPFNNMDVF